MNDRFLFNAVVSSYYDIDTPEHYEEFEPKIYLENVDLFSGEIGIDYDRLLEAVQNQLKLEKPEISQVMQHFEDNSNSNSEEYVTIKPDKILQSTGLKDKNGKLIYEGDIIVIPNQYPFYDYKNKEEYQKYPNLNETNGEIKGESILNYIGIVEWIYSQWQYVYHCVNPIKKGISEGINCGINDCGYDENKNTEYLIIGNMYENPELLKECE